MDQRSHPTPRPMCSEAANLDEVADRFGISRTLVYKLAKEDRLPLPVIRLGRRIVVPRASLDRLLTRNESVA